MANIVFFMQDTGAVFGAERATIDLAVGLRDAGETPTIFLIEEARLDRGESMLRKALQVEGLPVEIFRIEGRVSRKLAREVRQSFDRIHGDVLHVIGYKANLHAWLSGIHPVVATVHGWLFRNDIKERLYDSLDRWCLRRCDHVICLSSYYEKLLLEKGVDPSRLSRIPSGLREIPSELDITSTKRTNPPVTFGMMGRFSEEKNHRLFLAAAKQVLSRYPESRFLIAGQGPRESDVRRNAVAMGLENAVEFCGYCDVRSFMASIDVYVICSKIENLPYSILEAMAWAKPVIGTRVGGIPDMINDGTTGRLVSSDHPGELAGAMGDFMLRLDSIAEWGRQGRLRQREGFSQLMCVEKNRQVYQRMEARRG